MNVSIKKKTFLKSAVKKNEFAGSPLPNFRVVESTGNTHPSNDPFTIFPIEVFSGASGGLGGPYRIEKETLV
jgi:hypothetical protein